MLKKNLNYKTNEIPTIENENICSDEPKEAVVNILGYKVICRTCDIEMDFDEIVLDYVSRNFINI